MEDQATDRPRILIVDDEKHVREAFNEWFTLRGFATDLAQDGVEAVEKCAANRYDVVTLDLHMPRMSGLDVLSILKRQRPELPVIVVTGYLQQSEEAALEGAARVLTKPVSLRKIEEEVRHVLSATAM